MVQTLAQEEGNRLVLVSAEGHDERAEIAHEALVTQWPRFQSWLQAAAQTEAGGKRTLDALIPRAASWATTADEKAKKDRLATGAEREVFAKLADARPGWLSADERAFVKDSNALQRRDRRRRILTRSTLAALVALVFALVATTAVMQFQSAKVAFTYASEAQLKASEAEEAGKQARNERDRARAQLLAAQARLAENTIAGMERAGALALESIDLAGKSNRPIDADAMEVASSALAFFPLSILEHGGPVKSLVMLPDGRLASGGDRWIKLWPKDGNGEPTTLEHSNSASSLAVLPDGRLASGGYEGRKLWPKDGKGEPTIFEYPRYIFSLAVLPDGTPASGGDDGRIKLWDGKGEPTYLEHGENVLTLAVLPDGSLASGGDNGSIKLWPKDGKGEPTALEHGSAVLSLAVLPDGRLASGGYDGWIRLWPKHGKGEPTTLKHGDSVGSMAMLPDGRLASSGKGRIKIWLVEEGS